MSTLTLTIDVTPETATLKNAKQHNQHNANTGSNAPAPLPLDQLESLSRRTHEVTDELTRAFFEPLPLEDLEALAGMTSPPEQAIGYQAEAEHLDDAPKPEDDF